MSKGAQSDLKPDTVTKAKEKTKKIFSDAAERLNEEAEIIKIIVEEILKDEDQKDQPSKPWLCLRRKTTIQLSILFQEISPDSFTLVNQVIDAFFYHNYYFNLIDPVDYHQVLNEIIKNELEKIAKEKIKGCQEIISDPKLRVSFIEPTYQEFLFLVAGIILNITSTLYFLVYQYKLTSEWCKLKALEKDYEEKFKNSLVQYKKRIISALDEKGSQSELLILTSNLKDLKSYFHYLKQKKIALLELLEQKIQSKAQIKLTWQSFIATDHPKLLELPLSRIEKDILLDCQNGERERKKIALAFSNVETETNTKITSDDNQGIVVSRSRDNEFSFLKKREVSSESFQKTDDKKSSLTLSIQKVKESLPKPSLFQRRAKKAKSDFSREFEKALNSLLEVYKFHYELYSTLCPEEFKSNSIPALRIQSYQKEYASVEEKLSKYLRDLNSELEALKMKREDLSQAKEIAQSIGEIESEILKLENDFIKELSELNPGSFTSSIPAKPPASSTIDKPPTDAMKRPSNCWGALFPCCDPNTEEELALLGSINEMGRDESFTF
jgi:hypothetical protein